MNISPVSNKYHENKNTNFNGISRIMQKQIYRDGQREILSVLNKHPRNSLVVGQLPPTIFEKIPKELRQEAIPEIMNAFSKAAMVIRGYNGPVLTAENFSSYTISDRHRPQIANDYLTNVFQKYGLIKSDENIDLEYFGRGKSSEAYRIKGIKDDSINDDEFLLKVYYRLENPNWHDAKTNGVHAELNNAMYWKKNAGQNTQKGKFYFGDVRSGYMVTNLIDEDSRPPQKIVSPYQFGINYDRQVLTIKDRLVFDSKIKGYNYKHSGMPVVNVIKNKSPYARNLLKKMGQAKTNNVRQNIWNKIYSEAENNETKLEALALSIKYLYNKTECIDKLLDKNSESVDQGLAYLLKYLPKEQSLKYFEKIAKRGNAKTQVVLFNEIPLLGKNVTKGKEIVDDIHVSLAEINPEKLLEYYVIAEKYAVPDAIEHLASSVYMLPKSELVEHYKKLAKIDNAALKERLNWKVNFLPSEFQAEAKEMIK